LTRQDYLRFTTQLCSVDRKLRWRIRTAVDDEVAPTARAKMAVGKDLPMRVQMVILLELMVPRGSAAEVARAWTKNSNVPRKAAGRAIPELSICKSCIAASGFNTNHTLFLDIAIS
jgi:hypothetical protein